MVQDGSSSSGQKEEERKGGWVHLPKRCGHCPFHAHLHPMARPWSQGVDVRGMHLYSAWWDVEPESRGWWWLRKGRGDSERTVTGRGWLQGAQKWGWGKCRGLGPRLPGPRHRVPLWPQKAQHGRLCIREKSDLESKLKVRLISNFIPLEEHPSLPRKVELFSYLARVF